MQSNSASNKKQYSFAISFLVAFSITIIGFVINLVSNSHLVPLLSWPVNIYFLLGFIALIVNLQFLLNKKQLNWITDIPTSVSAIITFSILVLLMGLIPQESMSPNNSFLYKMGLTNIVRSWSFMLISFYLLLILGFVILKRLNKFNFRNAVFILNHLGLWITIMAASLGSGDVLKFEMTVKEGQKTNIVRNEYNQTFEMPFDVELIDFRIDEYIPQLTFVNPAENKILLTKKEKHLDITKDATIPFRDWNIKIVKYIEDAYPKDSANYAPISMPGAAPAAFIDVQTKEGKSIKKGWITCGNAFIPQQILYLNVNQAFAMLAPAPKKFSSSIRLHANKQSTDTLLVEVNKPISVESWKIYQINYDSDMGKWSQISVFQLVRDPWIKFVYIGIGMLLLGSILLFWAGKNKES